MEIKRATRYERCGCNFYATDDRIAYVEYFDESSRASAKLPLEGFGQGTFYDYLDMARAMIKEKYGDEYKELLAVLVLVVRLTAKAIPPSESK